MWGGAPGAGGRGGATMAPWEAPTQPEESDEA